MAVLWSISSVVHGIASGKVALQMADDVTVQWLEF